MHINSKCYRHIFKGTQMFWDTPTEKFGNLSFINQFKLNVFFIYTYRFPINKFLRLLISYDNVRTRIQDFWKII